MNEITKEQWGVNVLVAVIVIGAIWFGVYHSVKAPEDAAFRNEFVGGCVTEANVTFCDCAYNELKKELGLDGLLEMSAEYNRTGIMPKSAYSAVTKCVDKI